MDGYLGPPDTGMRGDLACAGRPRLGRPAGSGRDWSSSCSRTCRTTSTSRSGLARTIVLRRELTALHAHNRSWRPRTSDSRARPRRCAADPAAIERVARDELGWVRAGEIVVDLSSPEPSPSSGRGHEDQAGQEPKQALGERIGYHVGRAHARVAGVRRCAASCWCCCGSAGSPTCARPAPTCAASPPRRGADRAARVQDRGARPHRRAPPDAAPRGGLRRRAGPAAADDGLPAAGVFGRRRLGGLPAGVRGGQLPGHVPPAGRRAAAGGGRDRIRGRALLRPRRAARGAGAVRRPRQLHRRVRAAQRRVPARGGRAPAPRAPRGASRTRSRRCARRRAISG